VRADILEPSLSANSGLMHGSKDGGRNVRAAFKAGIKPSLITRQFGISQSDGRKVLASVTATHKGT
jgi:hypothetical protein